MENNTLQKQQNSNSYSTPMLSQTFVFCFYVFFVFFFGFVVFPQDCYRPGPHKIDLTTAENLGFGDVLAKNHCKAQCIPLYKLL